MNSNQRKILLAFSTVAGKGLMKEVFTQMDRRIRIDFAGNETDILYYLSRHRSKFLPGLIIFDNPPVTPAIAEFIYNIHKDDPFVEIPIALVLSPPDIPAMQKWVRSQGMHFFPRPNLPSECKLYVRQMLGFYNDPSMLRLAL